MIPDIGVNIGHNIGCPDIGVSEPPISSSISDTISGIKLPVCSPGVEIIMTIRL